MGGNREPVNDTVFCPNCGTRISARARFCPSCGARQDEFRVEPPAPPGADTPPPPDPPREAEPPLPEPAAVSPARDVAPPPPDVPPPPRDDLLPPADPSPSREDAPSAWPHPPVEPPPAAVTPAAATPPPAAPAPDVLPPLRGDTVPEAKPPPPTPPKPLAARPPEPVTPAPATPPPPPEYSTPEAPVRPAAAPRSVQERLGRVDPHAAELSGLLKERLAVPGLVAAGIAGSISAAIVLAAGLLIAVITPDTFIVGAAGVDANVITEGFRQAVGTLLTPMLDPGLIIGGSRRIHPLILVAIPLTALALTTRRELRRTEGAPPLQRLGWALAVAAPFGLWMLVFAIIGGNSETTNIDVSAGNAFALGILWGLVGGFIGAVTKIPLTTAFTPPAPVNTALTAVQTTLRPLAALLITCTAIGLVGWLVQVGADVGDVRAGRSAPTALIEEAVFAGEHGVHLTALAAGARFRADANGALGLPFPVERANDVPGADGTFRIFAYNDVLPAYVLLPALILLMGLVILAALYAGFTAARSVGAQTLPLAAAWGAITGPAWAIAMTLLALLAGGLFHGDADDASVFGVFLFGGALLGAAGGALSAQSRGASSPGEAPPDASS